MIAACGNGDLPPTPLTDPSTTPTVEAASVPNITTSAVVGMDSSTTGSTEFSHRADGGSGRISGEIRRASRRWYTPAWVDSRPHATRCHSPMQPIPTLSSRYSESAGPSDYWVHRRTNPWRDWVLRCTRWMAVGTPYALANGNLTTAQYGSTTAMQGTSLTARTICVSSRLRRLILGLVVTLTQPDVGFRLLDGAEVAHRIHIICWGLLSRRV